MHHKFGGPLHELHGSQRSPYLCCRPRTHIYSKARYFISLPSDVLWPCACKIDAISARHSLFVAVQIPDHRLKTFPEHVSCPAVHAWHTGGYELFIDEHRKNSWYHMLANTKGIGWFLYVHCCWLMAIEMSKGKHNEVFWNIFSYGGCIYDEHHVCTYSVKLHFSMLLEQPIVSVQLSWQSWNITLGGKLVLHACIHAL